MTHQEWTRGDYRISTNKDWLDLNTIHAFLRDRSYWARGVPRAMLERSVQHSLCFGVYHHTAQVGFGRIITDYATFAYLSDVFIVEEYRGQGLGKWLVCCMLAHPEIYGIRYWTLKTADAHSLYQQAGFTALPEPEQHMERIHSVPRDGALDEE
jgi:GNAT superfamily N-acetyltransferase